MRRSIQTFVSPHVTTTRLTSNASTDALGEIFIIILVFVLFSIFCSLPIFCLCYCHSCNRVIGRHSNSLEGAMCGCGGSLELEKKLRKDGTPFKTRQPTGIVSSVFFFLLTCVLKYINFAAWHEFIKGNMKITMSQNPGASKAEIMGMLKDKYHLAKSS